MTTHTIHTVDVPRSAGGEFDPASHRIRRRALEALRALDILGEPYTYRVVMANGSSVPSDEFTEQDAADVLSDLELLGVRDRPSLEALIESLYGASSHHDRSRVAPALDRLLDCIDHWTAASPECIAALFERLEPSRLVRAVGQTLLAATLLARHRSPARRAFLSRFLDDLRVRGIPEATIRRLEQGLES